MKYLAAVIVHAVMIASCFAADEAGFLPLFNGTDLTGWIGSTNGYKIEDGAIVCRAGGNLYSEKQYSDFILRFEFKVPANGNNGIGIRTPLHGDAAYLGMEIQVLDDTGSDYKKLKPWQYHGSIYGAVPAEKGHQKPVGEWNEEEISAIGARIKVVLNGVKILDADVNSITNRVDNPNFDKFKGYNNKSGYVGFLGHGSPVAFKNIRIKDLGGAAIKNVSTNAAVEPVKR